MELPFDLAILLLGLYPKNPKTPIQKSLYTPMSIAVLFTIAKCWKQPKCSSVNEWIKKLWYIYTMEFYAAERKKGAPTLCDIMDGTGEHYVKWNKPGGEGQIPYDLTFNWNIINKRKKQTKYNQTLKLRTIWGKPRWWHRETHCAYSHNQNWQRIEQQGGPTPRK